LFQTTTSNEIPKHKLTLPPLGGKQLHITYITWDISAPRVAITHHLPHEPIHQDVSFKSTWSM